MSSQGAVRPLHHHGHPGIRHVFVRDLVIPALIGIHTHESLAQSHRYAAELQGILGQTPANTQ